MGMSEHGEEEGSMLSTLAMIAQEANEGTTDTILWIIAAVLVIAGIVTIVRGGVLWGVILIIAGLLVGPGGVSILD
jgi:type II secretory pathway component PulF